MAPSEASVTFEEHNVLRFSVVGTHTLAPSKSLPTPTYAGLQSPDVMPITDQPIFAGRRERLCSLRS